MRFDIHVHIAQLGAHMATDRFLVRRPNVYVRMFLRQLGLSAADLGDRQINALIRQRLVDWVSRSSIERFVLLAMDGVYDVDGLAAPMRTSWMVDNDFVAGMAEAHSSLLFGASVHPYRKDALDELDRLVGRSACLMKWIPSAQRIRLDDPRCTPFYERLTQQNVPLLIHTGNEHASARGPNAWNDPALLQHPLSRGVKVIAAHCGTRMFLHERCYFKSFCRLAREHEHLYGDLGAFGIPTRLHAIRQLQKNPDLLAKIVYGSDFPAFPLPRWFVFSIGRQAVREILREANPLARPCLLMRKLGMPDAIFTRASGILRLSSRERVAP